MTDMKSLIRKRGGIKLQTTIEEISEEDAVQQQYSEREAMENDYIQSISKAKLMLSHNGEADETNTNSVRSSLVTNDHISNVKLPRIQLPKFSGDYESWIEFKDTFTSIVHENSIISNVQKLHYLNASVQGQAAQEQLREFWEIEEYSNSNVISCNFVKNVNIQEQLREFWEIEEYSKAYVRCLTVTYGTTSAPYLAIRSLQQVAHDNKQTFPIASKVILEDFYVDDLLTGTNTIKEAITLCNDLESILRHSGFKLRQWVLNNEEINSQLKATNSSTVLYLNENNYKKTLGLVWDSNADLLKFDTNNGGKDHLG
ncbi:Protein of unknown function (DUF1759) [Popillia japonica]|uniref:Reverse transcriptase domain-containing protein n=1 Tax=Popillia japonica TaxID=7064 RepID=A0AAW1JIS1_POPJA